MSQSLSQAPLLTLEGELMLGVDPSTEIHWNEKIALGIVPTEAKQKGFDPRVHLEETQKLASFEVEVIKGLLNGPWKDEKYSSIRNIHYFGIGTGLALEEVVKLANRANYRVNAYDVSSFATQNMNEVLGAMDGLRNKILLADIEDVCERKDLFKKGDKIIAPRVLEILSKQEQNWQKKARTRRKSARTARKIGSLLSLVEILLINLITNAAKYSPTGSKIKVSLKIEKVCVRVSIEDFGIGISRNDRSKVFNRFFQTSKTTERNHLPGLGLGLYIAKIILKHHEGRLEVKSKRSSKGSVFSFSIPYERYNIITK